MPDKTKHKRSDNRITKTWRKRLYGLGIFYVLMELPILLNPVAIIISIIATILAIGLVFSANATRPDTSESVLFPDISTSILCLIYIFAATLFFTLSLWLSVDNLLPIIEVRFFELDYFMPFRSTIFFIALIISFIFALHMIMVISGAEYIRPQSK